MIETIEDNRNRLQHFTVDTIDEEKTIRSLILAVNQKQPGAHVTLYIDCVSYGMIATPRSMKNMYDNMDEPQLKVVSNYHFKSRYYVLKCNN